MKKANKFISLITIMVLILNLLATTVYAIGGNGTEENPYVITTAEELQNINNNVSAYYILGADINLNGVDFVTIGNADSGAFSGSFDGNGYTISNLNVFSGKYAGLFGSNEGVVKNVVLKNCYVYGTRYIGGVVAENTSYGTIENCNVKSGLIETDGGINTIYIGGVCGINRGVLKGDFSNGAEVYAASPNTTVYAGGICGYLYTTNTPSLSSIENIGEVYVSSNSGYAGGISGYVNGDFSISDSKNINKVSSQHEVGGFFGYAYNSIIIDNCINAGDIVGDGRAVGGFVGVAYGNAIINKSYNTGEILSASLCGGLVGAVYGYGGSSITNSFNTGSVSGAASSSSAGGLIGGLYGTTSIINSYNTGNVHGRYSGGLVGDANRNTLNVSGFYNTGYLVGDWYIGTIYGTRSVDCQINISSSFCLNESLTGNNRSDTFAIPLNTNEMQNIASFDNWDFDTLWDFDSCAQNSYPVLRDVSLPLTLNYSNKVMRSGETIQLVAYKNGVQTDDVEWSISAGVGSVTSNGRLTPGCGPVTVVATDAEGNKANFNAYVFVEATSVNVTNKTLNIAYGSQNIATSFDVLPDIEYKDYIINYESSNESVAIVDKYGTLTPISAGFVEITATTIGGVSSKMTVTIVADATQISLPNTFYVERGETQKIPLTVLPNPTTSEITWTSSDVTVATVDSEGNIKGIKSGKTIITVTTHNGLSATSTVTVKAPITEMAFETPSLTLYIGDEYNTQLNIIPTDTTDTITYSSSNSYTASVSTKGVITAKQAGFVTITATSSSGQKAYCNITIKQWPSVVTLVDSQASIDKDIITTNTTAIRNLSKLITAKEGYTLDVTYSHTTNGLNYCGTGTVINVYDDYGNFVISYTLVVNGDINGDSVCNALDVTDTERMSTDALTFSALQAYAANGSPKEIVDVSSYQYVLNKALAE